jgi:hypothetical protein
VKPPNSVTSQGQEKRRSPNLKKKEVVVVCCLARAIAHLKDYDRWVWCSDGMMTGRGKPKKFGEKSTPVFASNHQNEY